MTDNINPDHYKNHPSGIECIEVTRHMNFNIGNAIKYLWRAGLKRSADQIEDLRKAIWYIEDEIKQLERQRDAENQTEFQLTNKDQTGAGAKPFNPPEIYLCPRHGLDQRTCGCVVDIRA